ncbi:MAG TPA: SDR family oxidoreductase [Chitinophagaceae bacterium]|nr:SDR family oxidoreductase [Chitinophagaceae bacterium]
MKHTVLITGASSGIGYEMAILFAKNGHDLILIARNASALLTFADELRERYHVQVAAFARDLTHLDEVKSVYTAIREEGVFIDFLVNNAGLGDQGEFASSDWNKQYYMMELNMVSLAYLTHLLVQDMKREKRGRIMNVASTAAFQPGPFMAVYYATKAFVLSFSEALSVELKPYQISVTTLCPGATQTNFANAANADEILLFKNRKLPTAASVAEYGFMAMMQGKRLAIPGFLNKLMTFSVRLSPRWVVLKIAAALNRSN